MSRKWSYKLVELKSPFLGLKAADIETALCALGMQGWELVSVTPHGQAVRLYLKKEA